MKAVICEKFGSPDVLELREIEKPQPKDDEVLIRNYASSINTADVISRSGNLPKSFFWSARKMIGGLMRIFDIGIRKPRQKVPGFGFAGEIVSVGKEVKDWKESDQVFGYSAGAFAEYIAVLGSKLARKPANISFEEAGAATGGSTPAILAFSDLAKPKKGQKVLIVGASGGIGTFAVQIAKLYETEVTGVCGPNNQDMVKELGADFVIDYTKVDYTKNSQTYDIIFDAIGANTFSNCKNILTKNGLYVSNNIFSSKKHILQLISSNFTDKKLKAGAASESADNYSLLGDWIEEGKIKPVIDNVYPLSQIAEAHRHYETGHSKGRVVISIQ